MGLFSKLKKAIFSRKQTKSQSAEASTSSSSSSSSASSYQPPSSESSEDSPVDIAEVLDGEAAKNSEKLDWRKSIVDLMKLVDMDSSYAVRKDLAIELGYSQEKIDADGSAAMNIWLHKKVLNRLAETGGKVPAEFID